MNKVLLTGNMVEKPELKQTSSNKSVCQFRIGVKRPFTSDKSDFFTIIAWEKKADAIAKYFDKGDQIIVSCHVINREWQDQNGNKRYSTEFNLEDFDFGSKKNAEAPASTAPVKPLNLVPIGNDEDFPF